MMVCWQRQVPEKLFRRAPPLFGFTSTITSHFGERFRDGQYSFASFFISVLLFTVPPSSATRKSGVGARAPWCPMESAPLCQSSEERKGK